MKIENLSQFIQYLATKAGVKAEDKNLVDILSHADLTKIAVNSELVSTIDENLLHIDAALDEHPKVRNKYTVEILAPLDKKLAAMIDEMSIDDPAKEELRGIRSTYQRFDSVLGKIKELTTAKAASTSNADKQALQAQIDNLQNELRDSKAATVKAKTDYEQQLLNDKKDFRLRNYIGSVKTTLDTLPDEVRNDTILNIINKHLQGQDAELRFDEKGDLQPYKKDGSKLYGANHTLITLPVLVDTLLAQNKLVQVSPQDDQTGAGGKQQQSQPFSHAGQTFDLNGIPGQQQISGINQAVMQANLEALKAFETADE